MSRSMTDREQVRKYLAKVYDGQHPQSLQIGDLEIRAASQNGRLSATIRFQGGGQQELSVDSSLKANRPVTKLAKLIAAL